MGRHFGTWIDQVGGQVSKAYERETGKVTLTFFTDVEEEMLELWFREGDVSPTAAANRILDGRRGP